MSDTTTATTMNGHRQEATDVSKLPNRVADTLAGRSILITGGTGFMGKVLIEKILRTCSDVDTIYVLIRAKKGKEPCQRVEELFASPVSEYNEKTVRGIVHLSDSRTFRFKARGRISINFGN